MYCNKGTVPGRYPENKHVSMYYKADSFTGEGDSILK